MGKIIINGGNRLFGRVYVHGSKNSVLPVMAAALMNEGITVIRNCPDIADVRAMCRILEYLECKTHLKSGCMVIDTTNAQYKEIGSEYTNMLRASSVLMGPMLVRFGKVKLAYPGGCRIGKRPLDIHLNVLKSLGAVWTLSDEFIEIETTGLHAAEMTLRFPSVGATQTAVMTASVQSMETVINNAAKEPEVVSLCRYLEKAGAVITGAGTQQITVKGKGALQSAEFYAGADRIVAGTYMAAVAACKGSVYICGCSPSDCCGFLDVFTGMGMQVSMEGEAMLVQMYERPKNLHYIRTGVYPEFPTDMQSLILSAASVGEGRLILEENIFENRFKTVRWLKKMGADITEKSGSVIVNGTDEIYGSEVYGEDLRGTAALIVAGLAAKNTTTVCNADYILRGYMDLCENLKGLGAEIEWVKS